MTDQPDLPPELLERVVETIKLCRKNAHSYRVKELAKQGLWPESNWWPSEEVIARAVAPMLIAHGRELEKAEVVEWLRQPTTYIRGISMAQSERLSDAIERNEHRSKP